MTQQYCLASMAAWLSSTGISHHNLLPHIPSICLSAIILSLHLGKAPQSLNSSTQPLHHLGMYGCGKDCLILIPFRLPQISCFSLKCFSDCRDRTPSSVPPSAEGRSSPTNTPVFPLVPSSYRVLCDSIYYFPLVRYSCLLSAGVLHALLCLKVYS